MRRPAMSCRGPLADVRGDLMEEAGRLEAVRRTGLTEITSSMMHDADTLLRRGYVRRPRSIGRLAIMVGSTATTLLSGLFAANLGQAWGGLHIAVSLGVGIVLTSAWWMGE